MLNAIKRIEGMTEFMNIFATFNLYPVKESMSNNSCMFNKVERAKMNKIVQKTEYLSVSL